MQYFSSALQQLLHASTIPLSVLKQSPDPIYSVPSERCQRVGECPFAPRCFPGTALLGFGVAISLSRPHLPIHPLNLEGGN